MKPFEVRDHTADVRVRVRGRTLPSLFRHAAKGLTALLARPGRLRKGAGATIRLTADTREDLLVLWLQELLYRYHTRRWLFGGCRLSLKGGRPFALEARVRGGAPASPSALRSREVKAVTYHDVRIRRARGSWVTDIVFDV